MDYYLTQEELESIMTCTEQIQRIIGRRRISCSAAARSRS